MEPDDGNEEHPPDRHPLDKIDLTHLKGEELKKMENLLLKHQTAFSRHALDIGKCPLKAPRVHLKEGVTRSIEPPRRYNTNQLQELIKQTNEFNSIGVIEPSKNNPSFLSQIVLASKIDPTSGEKLRYARFCLDLRRVNKILVDSSAYAGAVPRTVDLFDSLAHSLKGRGDDAIYAKLDISSAFFNIELPEEDRDYFTFATPIGNYRPTRCTFGSKFSPNAFSTILGLCLATALWVWIWAFLDDLLIAGANFDELLQHLDFVLYRLRPYGFKLKPSKAMLAKKEVPMLGFLLSGSKLFVDPLKRESMRLWAKPTLKKECLSFTQFANFLRKGIPNFSEVTAPLYKICNSEEAFEWTKEADEAFQHLKKVIADNAALYLPNFSFTWFVVADWCSLGGSWSLMQRENDTTGAWRQVLFGSRPNSKSERNYPSYFGEAFNVVNAINSCRMYLETSKATVVMTDRHSLTKLFTQKHLSAFQVRFS